MDDCRRNRAEREHIRDNLVTRLDPSAHEGQIDSRAARVQANTILVPCVRGEVLLALRDLTCLRGVRIVTVEPTTLHEINGLLLTGFRDGVGGLNVLLQRRHFSDLFFGRKSSDCYPASFAPQGVPDESCRPEEKRSPSTATLASLGASLYFFKLLF